MTTMRRGQHVEIHSLKGRPELNGKAGRIMGYDEAKGRYAVRVQAESILLKGDNLRRVAAQVEEVEESWESHDARLAEEQHAAFEQAQVQMSSGTPSSYRDAVKLALKCAGLAARRAALVKAQEEDKDPRGEEGTKSEFRALQVEVLLRAIAKEEFGARSVAVTAHLRCGDPSAALREAGEAVAAAERSGHVPSQVDASVMRGLALLHLEGPHAALGEHERALQLCVAEVKRCEEAMTLPPEQERLALVSAEASARSNVARDLHGLGRKAEALEMSAKAVEKRREALALEEAKNDGREAPLKAAIRSLSATLCNHAAMLADGLQQPLVLTAGSSSDDDGTNGHRSDNLREMFEEAAKLARASGDKGLEQTALTNLTNYVDKEPPQPQPPASSDADAAAAAAAVPPTESSNSTSTRGDGDEAADEHLKRLRQVMAETGRSASTSCVVCLEDLGDTASELTSTHCGHFFHRACLGKWLERSDRCPTCQESLVRH